jgi:hypothetical protein
MMGYAPKSPIYRFIKRVDKNGTLMQEVTTPCWSFISKGKKYSSVVSFNAGNGKIVSARLFSFDSFVGTPRKDKFIIMKCMNPICVNPEHMKLGDEQYYRGCVFEKDGVLYKKCSNCGNTYVYTDEFFYPDHINRKRKFSYRCKKCFVLLVTASRTRNWAGALLRESKRGAESRGLEFSITTDDIKSLWETQGGRCYWTGLKMTPSVISKYPSKPSLDRLDGKRGYTPDNIVLCCLAINIGRNSSNKQVFEDFILKLNINIDTSLWRPND